MSQKTAFVDGREMTASEIREWVKENRGYTISLKTIYKRMNAGLFGEVLISRPTNRPCCRECDKPVYCKGLCNHHYHRQWRAGQTDNGKHHLTSTGQRLVVPIPVTGWGFNTKRART